MARQDGAARRALTAIQRFGLGPRPGLVRGIGGDPVGALLADLDDPLGLNLSDASLLDTVTTLRTVYADNEAVAAERQRRSDDSREWRVARARSSPEAAPAALPSVAERERADVAIFRAEAMARLARADAARLGVGERLVLFWSHHFCVSVAQGSIVRATAGAYEREAIRPHVLGRFEDMLLAVVRHPAMLEYLDNRRSIGPDSPAGRRQRRGLNENLAREILELHTLGVDGGYGQADVTALANILTGWSFIGPASRQATAGAFVFNASAHQPGDHVVLGRRYPEGGVEQGEAALRDLARHPATARHIARKLARHFVGEHAAPVLAERLAAVFRTTDGDLAAVTRALVTAPEALAGPLVKLTTPQEFWLAAMRIFGVPPQPGPYLNALVAMGMPLWRPPGPNGFGEGDEQWAAPRTLSARLDVAAGIARGAGGAHDPRQLAEALWDGALSPATRQAIARAETRRQGLALLLMAPEFVRR